ncbi:chaperone modulator CbpM [Sodalis sp. RH21]|uniref:chaperone modulator CbpM n=1 Tax=unclassified Sodalis (in: enterobacteria) TaxID=2636512 RepID=UPI0039B41BA0
MTEVRVTLEITEICQSAAISRDELFEVVALGIIAPRDKSSDDWRFEPAALYDLQRAQRLRQDLEIDWAGVALAVSLLDEIRRLKTENRQLLQRLDRFILK